VQAADRWRRARPKSGGRVLWPVVAFRYTQGPIAVQAVTTPKEQREPEVPNVPETYRIVGTTLAILIGSVVLVIGLAVWLWRRRRA
jgi:hypothetical protein